jgi:hypothetical protein
MPALNTSIAVVGHFSAHDPQPVHRSSLTKRAFLCTLIVKLPASPPICSISL